MADIESIDIEQSAESIVQIAADTPEVLLVPAALWIGSQIKNSKIDDAYIPIIVIALTGVAAFIILSQDMTSFITGLRTGLYTVASHQSFKQLNRKAKTSTKKKSSKSRSSRKYPKSETEEE